VCSSDLASPWILKKSLYEILLSLGINRSLEEIREASKQTRKDFNIIGYTSEYGRLPHKSYWNRWLSFVLRHLDLQKRRSLLEDVEAKWFDSVECKIYPDVKETLARIRRMGLRTGLTSAAYEEDLGVMMKKAGVRKNWFDVVVGANTTKTIKPHLQAFKYAPRKLEVKPEEALFIGDNMENDYEPASKLGMRSVLICWAGIDTKKTRGLRMITSLSELFEYID